MAVFDSIGRTKAYSSIVDQLIERIARGDFRVGERLPAERELASQFGVSRATLKEAIRVLEHSGVLEARAGSGTYVTQADFDADVWLRAQAETEGDYSPLDIIVARRAIEPVSARSASVTASVSDREAVRSCLREQARATEAGEDPTEADLAFHLAIARASKNAALITLTEQLMAMMRRPSWTRLKGAARSSDIASGQFLQEHERIAEAIDAGDGLEAEAAMKAHLSSIERGLREQAGYSP